MYSDLNVARGGIIRKKEKKKKKKREYQKFVRFTSSGERENRDRSIIDGTIYNLKKKKKYI